MKLLLSIFIFYCAGLCAQSTDNDVISINQSFENYKKLLAEKNGKEAAKLVDKNTINYYESIVLMAKRASFEHVKTLNFMDKFMVLSVRHYMTKDEILKSNGTQLFEYAVSKGWIDANAIKSLTLGKVNVQNNLASVQLLSNGNVTPINLNFSREVGKWKVDLTSLFPSANTQLKSNAPEKIKQEEEQILQMLEKSSGQKPSQNIWKPVM